MPRRTPRRRITKARISTISLVPRGANQMPVIYKSDGETAEFDTILKDDRLEEHGELTAIVYAPEQTDSQGDVASADVVKDMAYDFARRGLGDIDLRHDGKAVPKNDAYVAESFIVQKGDERFKDTKDYNGEPVDVTGAWAVVLKIEDEGLRKLYRDGKWNGVSMFGDATVKAASEDGTLVQSLLKALGSLVGATGPRDDGELDMDEKRLNEILDKRDEGLVAKITKAMSTGKHDADTLKKAGVEDGDSPEVIDLKVELFKAKNPDNPATTTTATKSDDDDKKLQKPVFDGDPTDEKAVAKFEYEVKKYEILREMDAGDPESVKTANSKLTELAKEAGEAAKGDEKDPEVARLEKELAKAKGKSNQPGEGDKPTLRLTKEDAEAVTIGKEIAAYANNDTEAIRKIEQGQPLTA